MSQAKGSVGESESDDSPQMARPVYTQTKANARQYLARQYLVWCFYHENSE